VPTLENFIYNSNRNFVFAYVPKVACTNWKCILRYLDGNSNYLDARLAHDREKSGLVFLSALPHRLQLLSSREVPKYTFVRSPYTRVLSAYLNKIEPFASGNATPARDPHFYTVFERIDLFRRDVRHEDAPVNFDCFVEWLETSGDPLTENEHWLPQSVILSPTEIEYSYVGRFEKIENDAKKLLDMIKCDIDFPTQEAVKFPGTNARQQLCRHYTMRSIETVKRIYHSDFDNFGYDRNDMPSIGVQEQGGT
jgi:hypothetical protein